MTEMQLRNRYSWVDRLLACYKAAGGPGEPRVSFDLSDYDSTLAVDYVLPNGNRSARSFSMGFCSRAELVEGGIALAQRVRRDLGLTDD